jgi:hypothetical protein
VNFPDSFLMVANNSRIFPLYAASSASLASMSTKFLLSALMFFYTVLFASAYSFWDLAFCARVRLLFIFAFFAFLSSMVFSVSAVSNVSMQNQGF